MTSLVLKNDINYKNNRKVTKTYRVLDASSYFSYSRNMISFTSENTLVRYALLLLHP